MNVRNDCVATCSASKSLHNIMSSNPGAYPEIWIRGSVKAWLLVPVSSPLPSRPVPSPFPSPFPSLLSPPLRSRPLNSARGSGGAELSSPSEVWGGAPAEIEFGTF